MAEPRKPCLGRSGLGRRDSAALTAANSGQVDSTPWDEARDQLLGELKQINPRGR
jgi:hypothetical protein